MNDTTKEHKQKKSQKRVDRQARRAEKRRQKELLEKHKAKVKESKPIKIKLSKKSLPGFLAKNVEAIIKWLKEYETLFALADDYGIQRLDRLPEEKRNLLIDNYVHVSEFISTLQEILEEEEQKKLNNSSIKSKDDDQYLNTDELDELADSPDEPNKINYMDEPKWEAINAENGEKIQVPPPNYFEDVQEYVNSLTDEFEDEEDDK